MIEKERDRRKSMWNELLENNGPNNLPPLLLREIGIFGGAQGVWVNKVKVITSRLSPDGHGLTVGLLRKGTMYPDDLSESGILYHYPRTNRPQQRDYSEIQATKAINKLSLPSFVITQSSVNPKNRDVKLGCVEEWDDQQELFQITFIDEVPSELLNQPGEDTPFDLIEESRVSTTQTKSRPGQKQFDFLVFERYSDRCAICDIDTL